MQTNRLNVGDSVTHGGTYWRVTAVRSGGRLLDLTRGGAGFAPPQTKTAPASAVRFERGASSHYNRDSAKGDPNWLDNLIGRMHDQIRAERAGRQKAADEALLTAYEVTEYHESGHAVIAHYFGAELLGVTTMRGDHELGRCAYDPESLIDAETRRPMQALIALAGRAAERLAPSWGPALADNTGHGDDQRSALRFLDGDQAAVRELERYAAELVNEHRLEIAVLAEVLHARGSVDGAEAVAVMESAGGYAAWRSVYTDGTYDTWPGSGRGAGAVSVRSGPPEPGWSERSAPFELDTSGDGLNLSGYAAVFNSATTIRDQGGEFSEVIAPGAFAESLRQKTPVLMFEHGRHPMIGTMPLGVIKQAREDSRGLHVTARLTDNWMTRPVRDAIRDGAVSGMSFRFTVPAGGDAWQTRSGGAQVRTINRADVSELGPVVFPAYRDTTVGVRAA